MAAVVVEWLGPADAEKLGAAAGRTLDAGMLRELARAVDPTIKVAARKAATIRLRRLLAVSAACAPKGGKP